MIIMTAGVLISMYILWKYVTRLEQRMEILNMHSSSRLDQLTNELYYSINGVDDKKRPIADGVQPYVVDQNIHEYQNDEASSVPSEDVLAEHNILQASGEAESEEEDGDVNAYIGNLKDKFVANDDDAESLVSGATLSGGRKKSPPQSAASFPVGHQQMHNGKLFEVIKTKTNVIRWGKPTMSRPPVESEETE